MGLVIATSGSAVGLSQEWMLHAMINLRSLLILLPSKRAR